MYRKIKKRIFEIINTAESGDKVSKVFDVFIISLIILNTVMVIVDTFDIPQELRTFTEVFETV
ncbi:MAG: hypothetical protein ACI4KR_04700, partial [Ruminiclostridium sp.]